MVSVKGVDSPDVSPTNDQITCVHEKPLHDETININVTNYT